MQSKSELERRLSEPPYTNLPSWQWQLEQLNGDFSQYDLRMLLSLKNNLDNLLNGAPYPPPVKDLDPL
ncbi:hypothetical protein [Deinococcus multiflagellatus]|uniref:Uncharacterized protein n=1 Tax=Deinococcus multiflagellatus TaxID=1656887 RepID=A0ABW1ZMU4_9DEIO|nr:hypothetical protein [Deinococcus multiflagellatus]MBZ9713931.1 hypothetical protein [Deinococcus multiflagellatus]